MPLIKCPDCNKDISNRAHMCPFCGCPSEYFVESEKTIEGDALGLQKNDGHSESEDDYVKVPDCGDQYNVGKHDFLNMQKNESVKLIEKDEGTSITSENEDVSNISDSFEEESDNKDNGKTDLAISVIAGDAPPTSDEEQTTYEAGKIQCPLCGAMINRKYKFCSSCGSSITPVTISNSDDKVLCRTCGKMVISTAKFCNFCGSAM